METEKIKKLMEEEKLSSEIGCHCGVDMEEEYHYDPKECMMICDCGTEYEVNKSTEEEIKNGEDPYNWVERSFNSDSKYILDFECGSSSVWRGGDILCFIDYDDDGVISPMSDELCEYRLSKEEFDEIKEEYNEGKMGYYSSDPYYPSLLNDNSTYENYLNILKKYE